MKRIHRWALAIMEFEGYAPNSISFNNRNPGNIKAPRSWAGVESYDSQGHAVFNTFENGYLNLLFQLELAVSGKSKVYQPNMTLSEFFKKYAERPGDYAEFVANRLGVRTTTPIYLLRY